MKKKTLFSLGLTIIALAAITTTNTLASRGKPIEVSADNSKLPTADITLRDNTESEIRSYYGDLNAKSANERTGTNLLKNLKPILKNGMKYYSYDNVWKVYEITDRDWDLSPAENDNYNGTVYDATTLTYTKYVYGSSPSQPGNDPYVHTLYRDRENPDSRIKEWGAHSGSNSTNREHVWCQSRGFKGHDGSEAAYGPAGTDVHHLISGDGKVNTNYHNDLPYGNVDKTKTYKDAAAEFEWLAGNFVGTPIKTSPSDTQSQVFEPRDEDKGDIARACFYMVARYNNLAGESGVISDYEPNLALADYATGSGSAEYSTDTQPVYMGIMSDLLEWNKLDPVDDYEIHRNNLIYENFQHNRNPFVDFPQWADYIWGENRGVKAAVPSTETLNTFTTIDADSVEGFESEFAVVNAKARLKFSYEKSIVEKDASATWRAQDIGLTDVTYQNGYSKSINDDISISVTNPANANGNNTTKYDSTKEVLQVFKNATLTISTTSGYLKRITFNVSTTSEAGKYKNSTSISSGSKSISSGNMTVTLTNNETALTVSQPDNSTYLSNIVVEYYGPAPVYSGFSDAEIQFGYTKEIPNTADVTAAGVFVTDDESFFSETALGEDFDPSEPDELISYLSSNKHGYVSKNTTLKQSWYLGVSLEEEQYSTTFHAAGYIFSNGEVTFSRTADYNLLGILEAYQQLSTLSLRELEIVNAFYSEVNG